MRWRRRLGHLVSVYDPQAAMLAVLRAYPRVRGGRWVKGAVTHVFAELLNELSADGWHLLKSEPLARAMHYAVRREPLRFECVCGGRWLTEADLELHLRFARKDAFRGPGVPHAGPECGAESRALPEGITEEQVARALNAWWASQQIGEDETRSMREALAATLQQGEDA
jgi:hypothetical protein